MSDVIDLYAHLKNAMRETSLQENPACDRAEVKEIVTKNLAFSSQINYHLDQLMPNTTMDTIDQAEKNNNSSQQQSMTISRTESISNSYSWSSEHSFSVGVEVSASFKVPFIGGIDTTISTSYSYSNTQTQSTEKVRSWTFADTVNVAPYTKVNAILMLEKTKPRIPFELTCVITGTVNITVELFKQNKSVNTITYTLAPSYLLGRKPLANFSTAPYTTYFKTAGVFTANEGIKAIIDITETPLRSRSLASTHHVIEVPADDQMPMLFQAKQLEEGSFR